MSVMWIMKLLMKHEEDIFTERTEKHQVNFYAYPLTHYKKGREYLFSVIGILEGEKSSINSFLKDIKNDKRVKKLEVNGEFVNILISYPLNEIKKSDMETYYDPSLIHIEPILNAQDGFEYWNIGSFERDKLTSLLNSAIKHHEGKLLSINNSKLNNFSLLNLTPKISEQQRKVILGAFKNGYYTYPRKIEIKELAKLLNISYSTCQEHLRKAEIALLPNMLKKL